jgi:hypothetical protein
MCYRYLAATCALALASCEREPAPTSARPNKPTPQAAAASVVEFPAEVQTDDPTVNEFVREAIGTCVSGDYERFRLLWNVREDPFPRGEFERGWKAVRKVTVLKVQKMRNPPEGAAYEGKYLYYVHGRVELDATMPEPTRDVLLLIIQEGERWRLARAPKNLRERVLGEQGEGAPGDAAPTSQESRSPEPARRGGSRG